MNSCNLFFRENLVEKNKEWKGDRARQQDIQGFFKKKPCQIQTEAMQSSAHQSQPSTSQGQQTSSHGPTSTGHSQPERASKGYTSSPLSAAATGESQNISQLCVSFLFTTSSQDYRITEYPWITFFTFHLRSFTPLCPSICLCFTLWFKKLETRRWVWNTFQIRAPWKCHVGMVYIQMRSWEYHIYVAING